MDGFGHAPPYDGVASPSTSLLPLAPLADAPPNSASDSVTPVDVQHHSPTFGFLDMGGASTQLAFSPTVSELDRSGFPPDQLRQVSLRLLSGESVEWPVFVASWLGFGTNQARERYIETLLSQPRESSESIPDPCLPVSLVVPTSLDDSTPSLVGTGNFGQCLKRLTPLLDHAHPCPTNHCLFGGQPTPHIDFSREDQRGFIGVSEYWYTAHQVLGLGGVWDWGEWEKGMNGFCAREWQGIEDQVDRDDTWQGSAVSYEQRCNLCQLLII
jgi:Golgi nucleoside diphosphatase